MLIRTALQLFSFFLATLLACIACDRQIGDDFDRYVSSYEVVSDRVDMSFKVGGKYFLASKLPFKTEQFIDAYNTCYWFFSSRYAIKTEENYISLELGYSKQRIIDQGTWLCMETKGWEIYEIDDDKPVRVDSNEIPYSNMPEWQLRISRELIVNQREWFKRYEPRFFAVGNLLSKTK